MRVGLLGLQGAFLDHIPHLRKCGITPCVVRSATELASVDRLILPGGESTVMAKYIREYGLLDPLTQRLTAGMPAWGICAGAILLAATVDGTPGLLQALPISVSRNAYGRQLESSCRPISIPLLDDEHYPAIFIRSPRIDAVTDHVTIHARLGAAPVFVQHGRIMVTTFHPELHRDDERFHNYFLSI